MIYRIHNFKIILNKQFIIIVLNWLVFDNIFFKLEFSKNHLEKVSNISILFVFIEWEFSIKFGTIEKYDFL